MKASIKRNNDCDKVNDCYYKWTLNIHVWQFICLSFFFFHLLHYTRNASLVEQFSFIALNIDKIFIKKEKKKHTLNNNQYFHENSSASYFDWKLFIALDPWNMLAKFYK